MHRLVVVGSWDAIEEDVAPLLTQQVRNFQASIRRDGFRKVRGPGILRHDCPENPNEDLGRDCFAYRLSGSQVVPLQGVRALNARFRLWVGYDDGRWQVVSYEYDLIPAG